MAEDRQIVQYLSTSSDSTPARALRAALTLFSRHGFARTSMADVAATAGMSRATLYVHFKDKHALLDSLAAGVVREALQHMRDAWRGDAAFGANLEAAILAKDLPLHRLKHASPHGGELFAANDEAVVHHGRLLEAGFVAFVRDRAADAAAAGRRFDAFGGPETFATFAAQAAAGLKDAVPSEGPYRTAVRTLAAVIEAATSAPTSSGAQR